jgi:glycosyltransferase involved in cell wall biosynthesis
MSARRQERRLNLPSSPLPPDHRETAVHLLHIFPSFQLGGSQRRFAALANHFGDGYRHTIVALDRCIDAAALLQPDVTWTYVQVPAGTGLMARIANARAVIRAHRPNVLVTYNWGAIEWAAANWSPLAPHIHIEDGFGPEEAARQLRRRVLFRRHVLRRRHSTVVLPSRTLLRLAADVWRLPAARTLYIPNGIPCARFRRPAGTITETFRGTGPVIGTVATLRKEKALDRLIEAFATVLTRQPARLVIVGDGPERLSLENAVALQGLRHAVTFTGGLSQPETAVAGFDVFALSSDTEQMPLSVLEAMAAGKPVAGTDVGDVAAMLAPENTPFVVPKDANRLAEALSRLLADADLRRRLGAANQARAVVEFDEARMFATYDSLFAHRADAPKQPLNRPVPNLLPS